MCLDTIGAVPGHQLIRLCFGEVNVIEPAFFHAIPHPAAKYAKKLASTDVRKVGFFDVFCAMVFSVAQQTASCSGWLRQYIRNWRNPVTGSLEHLCKKGWCANNLIILNRHK